MPTEERVGMGLGVSFRAFHNVVIAEEGSILRVVAGCSIVPELVGLHVGISELYVKRNAVVTFIMIHDWAPTTNVRPRTAAVAGDGGSS